MMYQSKVYVAIEACFWELGRPASVRVEHSFGAIKHYACSTIEGKVLGAVNNLLRASTACNLHKTHCLSLQDLTVCSCRTTIQYSQEHLDETPWKFQNTAYTSPERVYNMPTEGDVVKM